MDKVKGSMEMLSSMQLTKDMAGLDAQSKMILHNKEVLAIILQDTVEEYKGYSRKEIAGALEKMDMKSLSVEDIIRKGLGNLAKGV